MNEQYERVWFCSFCGSELGIIEDNPDEIVKKCNCKTVMKQIEKVYMFLPRTVCFSGIHCIPGKCQFYEHYDYPGTATTDDYCHHFPEERTETDNFDRTTDLFYEQNGGPIRCVPCIKKYGGADPAEVEPEEIKKRWGLPTRKVNHV